MASAPGGDRGRVGLAFLQNRTQWPLAEPRALVSSLLSHPGASPVPTYTASHAPHSNSILVVSCPTLYPDLDPPPWGPLPAFQGMNQRSFSQQEASRISLVACCDMQNWAGEEWLRPCQGLCHLDCPLLWAGTSQHGHQGCAF